MTKTKSKAFHKNNHRNGDRKSILSAQIRENPVLCDGSYSRFHYILEKQNHKHRMFELNHFFKNPFLFE